MSDILLGVNIDHVATLRNTRGTLYPDPVQAAFIAEQAGADSITVHLREDRRHITDRDVFLLRKTIQSSMNLEMAPSPNMVAIACELRPHCCCLVPEHRQEITTEKGLDLLSNRDVLFIVISDLQSYDIEVALFIEGSEKNIAAAVDLGVSCVELHTGPYIASKNNEIRMLELNRLKDSAQYAIDCGLKVNAGHGLDYHHIKSISQFPFYMLHIGHAIIGRSIFSGLFNAVKEMRNIIINR